MILKFQPRRPIRALMQRLDALRTEAKQNSVHYFASQWPTPVLLLRYVAEGELNDRSRGPEGTMRHSLRRTLSARLSAPPSPGRRPVGVERVAAVRGSPGEALRPSYLIGRDDRCDVVLNDYTISAEHARMHYLSRLSRWMIEDLDSTNCTFQNGGRLPPHERGLLTSLDEVQLGRMVFLYLEPPDLYAYLRGNF